MWDTVRSTLLKTLKTAATVCVGAIDSSAAIGAHLALSWRSLYRASAARPRRHHRPASLHFQHSLNSILAKLMD
ncbi:unnamed protein product [Arctia plantaginis]|uniref:Uncharacterized protein n=1 Tax=Arctia plantaginis TaxID=874455 RepID=A0A8S1AX82_ARCPL|nr:unnamed protein product [Arctia plantaginis]